MSHVFVSYSREDELFVFTLMYALEQRGIPFWVDRTSIQIGDYWDDSVERAIEEAFCVLLVSSTKAIESQNVKDELGKAHELKKPIVPVRIDAVTKLPIRLNRLQYIDFVDDYHRGMQQLEERLLNLIPIHAEGNSSTIRTDFGEASSAWESGEKVSKGRIYFPEDKARQGRRQYPQLHVQLNNGEEAHARSWVMNIASVTIGRSWHCDIVVEDKRISANHIKVYWENSGYLVEDLNSSNGTVLNGKTLKKKSAEKLSDGDEITLAGICKIRFTMWEPLDKTVASL